MSKQSSDYRIMTNGSKFKIQKKFLINDNNIGFCECVEDWIDYAEKKWWFTPKTVLYKTLEAARNAVTFLVITEHNLDWETVECISYSPEEIEENEEVEEDENEEIHEIEYCKEDKLDK